MKPAHSLALCIAVAASAFLAGRLSVSAKDPAGPAASRDAQASPASAGSSAKPASRSPSGRPMNMSRLSEQGARRMSPEERLDILAKGALVFDGNKQADMLCGLLAAMTKEEMPEATRLLAEAQDGGNACAQAVWDTLWKQWGRVDPVGCIEYFAANSGSKTRSDARFLMEGWLEVDPAAALAWARQPRESRLDSAAAAMAITWDSSGDPQRLQGELLSMPAGSPVTRECLLDYFDLASLDKDSPSAAEIHARLPPALQQAAWTVTLQRLTYTNPQAAKDWLEKHAGDPGQDYNDAGRLIEELCRRDLAGTAKWAAGLPPAQGPHRHPAEKAIDTWLRADRPAALAWLATLPPGSPWLPETPAE